MDMAMERGKLSLVTITMDMEDTAMDMVTARGKPRLQLSLVTIIMVMAMDMVTDTMVKRSAVYLLSCKTSVNLNLIENNLVKRNTPQKEIQNLDVEIKRIT